MGRETTARAPHGRHCFLGPAGSHPAGTGAPLETRIGDSRASRHGKKPGSERAAAWRPEGSRAMKPEAKSELKEMLREGLPIFLTNFIGGMLIGCLAVLLMGLLRQ